MNFSHSPVLFIGLDALDWKLLSAKIAEGELPNLAKLVTTGSSGPSRSLHPLFSPTLWSTIATGKRSYEHGITGFTLPDDSGHGLKSYDSTSRHVPALWNILSDAGKKSNIVGWWTTHPAEKIHGVMVDETFAIAHHPAHEPWPLAKESVTPLACAEELKQCRVHPQEIPEALLRSLVPKLYEIDLSTDVRISGIAKILAEDLTNLNVALHLMAQQPWDFTSVYLIGLDSLCHQAMDYRAPALSGRNPRDIEYYGEVVDRAYQLYDTWVGKLIAAAGKETTIVIASDHGFYHDHGKPTTIGIEATAPCMYHAPMGSLILSGPQVRQNFQIKHASILDLCPTILALLNLPAGRDMKGHILREAFNSLPDNKRIASWDERCLKHSKKTTLKTPSAETTTAALKQLVALGYLQELPTDQYATVKEAQVTQLFHRALSYLSHEQLHHAIPLLEKARKQAPGRSDILSALASTYVLMGEGRRAAANFKQLVRCRCRDAAKATQELWTLLEKKDINCKRSVSENWILRRLLARIQLDEEAMKFTIALANWHAHHNLSLHSTEAAKTGSKKNALDLLLSIAKNRPEYPYMALHAARTGLASGYEKDSFALLHQAAAWNLDEPEALAIMAEHENALGNFSRAETLAREALERNPLDAPSWLALATALTAQSQWQEAREAATRAAESALRKSKACDLLAEIALKEKNDPALAARYQKISQRATKRLRKAILKPSVDTNLKSLKKISAENHSDSHQKFIFDHSSTPQPLNTSTPQLPHSTIVTGLPRSGTSLLMQMLAAGGMEIFTDLHRSSDEHNPRGYFEHEKIKNIANDFSFLNEAIDKVLKIVIPLLWELPESFKGNILWIRRDLNEVITSQKKMAGLEATPEELLKAYRYYEEKTSEIIASQGWRVLELTHAAVLADPKKIADAINDFLGGRLDVEAMVNVVEPSLHRVKKRFF